MEENNNISIKIDMTGWKMWEHGVPDSRLTVLCRIDDYISPSGNHKAYWKCICSCPEHNIIDVVGSSYLGSFSNKDDAIKARLNAEAKYFGKFAPQRHLFEQYGINTKQNDLKEEIK